MAKVKIKYVRSAINRPKNQKRTIEALGFKRLYQVIEKEASPQVMGMVNTVSHLVKVID
ncbi:50S ribosomal protein L30 [Crocinitomix catalasitica]|nr:50S ribosomal protein L30 [Crocinitomix catalasitica]